MSYTLAHVFLLLAAAGTGPGVPDDADAPMSLTQVTERLSELGKGAKTDSRRAAKVAAALAQINKVCGRALQRVAGLNNMAGAYARALQGDTDRFQAGQLRLILSARNDLRCVLVAQGAGCEEVLTGAEALGLCSLYSEGMAYTLAPCNAFLRRQIDHTLPRVERDFLALEEAYFAAFNGEYLNEEALASVLKRGQAFITAHASTAQSALVRGFIVDLEAKLKASQRGAESALNSGPGVSCQ